MLFLEAKKAAKIPFCTELLITVINFTWILLFMLIMVMAAMDSQKKKAWSLSLAVTRL